MLLDAPAEIQGSQTPTFSSVPQCSSSGAEEAVELAAVAGLDLDPWQQLVLRGSLGERVDGRWAAFEVGLIVPRQNGKGGILEARQLAGLYLFGERLIMYTSQQFKTSLEAFRRVLGLIENTPDLDRRVKRVTRSHGEEGIELKGGQRLRFVARSGTSGRGFSGDCVMMDEAMILGDEEMGALLPTLSARPNPQIWYSSSAGNQDSTQLARVVRRGRAGKDSRLAYFEWCAAEDDPHDSVQSWAKANPALGIRISAEHIGLELAALDFTEFSRERLGIGTYPVEEGDQWPVISESAWTAAADRRSQLVDPVAFAVDVSPDQSYATIAVAGGREDGLRHVEIVEHSEGTAWVADRLVGLWERWEPVGLGLDLGGPAGSLENEIKEAGIEVVPIGSREVAQACGAFYNAVMGTPQLLRHRGQIELTAAVRGARKRPLADAWAWSRRGSSLNLSPLIAATLALHVHMAAKATSGKAESWFLN